MIMGRSIFILSQYIPCRKKVRCLEDCARRGSEKKNKMSPTGWCLKFFWKQPREPGSKVVFEAAFVATVCRGKTLF